MKLSEALDVLLKADDEAVEAKASAEREAKAIIQKAHDEYAQAEDTLLSEARKEAANRMSIWKTYWRNNKILNRWT